jgi:hypothetical protein
MKQLYIFFILMLIMPILIAQVPQKFSYQAVVRDADNKLVVNKQVGMRVSILKGNINGVEVFKELCNPNPFSNSNGLITVEIGSGAAITGNFSKINWAEDSYYIKTEIDPLGGTNYTIIGTTQLLSVPYALHAKTVENDGLILPYHGIDSINNSEVFKIENTSISDLNSIAIKAKGAVGISTEGHYGIVATATKLIKNSTDTPKAIQGIANENCFSGYFEGGFFRVNSPKIFLGKNSIGIERIFSLHGYTSSNSHETKINLGFHSSFVRVLSVEIKINDTSWYGGTHYTSSSGGVNYALKDNYLYLYVEPNSTYREKPYRILCLEIAD